MKTGEISTVPSAADTHEALKIVRAERVRRLVVTVPDGTLVGTVLLDDIVDALGAELTSLAGMIRSEREREIAQHTDQPALHS